MGKRRFYFYLLLFSGLILAEDLSAQFFLPWDFYDIATDIRESGANPDFTIQANGTVHVSYWHRSEDKLVYAQKPAGGNWTFERVDNSGRNGFKSSLELGLSDTVFIAYHEDINGSFQVRLAKRLGPGNWEIEQIPDTVTQFGKGWGDYGNWTDAVRTESVKQSLDLEINAAGEPRIAFFASWYKLNSTSPCGTFYQSYELQPYYAWRSAGTWNVNQLGDYSDKLNKCNGQPLPFGDRYGEWLNLLTDPLGNESIVTNSYFNREILQMHNSGNNITWNPSVIDSQPTISTNFCCGSDVNLFTMESPSAAYDKDGNLHVSYTTSFVYGLSFHPNLAWWYTIVYVRVDTNGNVYQNQREPVFPEKPYRNNTHILPLSSDTIFMSYYQGGEGAAFYFSESYDSGQTWATDTMLHVLSSEKAKIEAYGDTIYTMLYDEGGDRLMLGKRAIADSVWSFVAVTVSQERADVFDAKTLATSSDTIIHMVYTDTYESKLYFNRGSVASGNWIGTEEVIGQGETSYTQASMTFGLGNEPMVVYSEGQNGQLKLAIDTGSGWSYEVVDSISRVSFADVAVSSDNTIHIAYYEMDSMWLRYASRPFGGGPWTYEIIDATDAPVGEYTDIVTDANNKVHVVYYRRKDRSVNYALQNGANNWTTEVVHSDSNLIMGRDASIEILANGLPAIAYADEIKYRVIFAEQTSPANWTLTTLDTSGTSIAPVPIELEIDKFGNPWVAYNYNDGFDRIKLQKRDSSTWSSISVSTSGRIANEFGLNIIDGDLYIAGKKNKIGETGIGLIRAREGLYIAIDPEQEQYSAQVVAYPNPAGEELNFRIKTPKSGEISLELYDLMGRNRKTILKSKWTISGESTVNTSISDLPTGIYFFRLSYDSYSTTGRVVILK